jgi:hypothetical protein
MGLPFDAARRVPYCGDPSYARDAYQWFFRNTGQPSTLFSYNNPVSQESGTNSLNIADRKAASVLVSVVDTGCDDQQPELAGVVRDGRTILGGVVTQGVYRDVNTGRNLPGHATMISSLISGRVCGIAPGTPLLEVATQYQIPDMVLGMRWSIAQGAKIIVLAWGIPAPDSALFAVCSTLARRANVAIVCAAPPTYVNLDTYQDFPTAWKLDNVLPVVATDMSGAIYASGYGPLTLAVPGRTLASYGLGGKLIYGSGTSYAVALAAGGLARLMTAAPGHPVAYYLDRLRSTGKEVEGGRSRQMDLTAALAGLTGCEAVVTS